MGGDIWFRPTDEGGSDFIFIIPVGPAMESPSRPDEVLLFGGNTPPDKEKLRRAKVLVAEDNRVNAMLILALLGKEGIRAQHVKNGALALEAVESQPYDLIFMDLQMPEMDGIEATRAIREWQKAEAKPPAYIVALTAEAMAGDREKCQRAGMDDYLPKPLRPAELQAALQRFTSKYDL
jgi:CheY-like chemotaxis protein